MDLQDNDRVRACLSEFVKMYGWTKVVASESLQLDKSTW